MAKGKRLTDGYEGIDRNAFYDTAQAVKLVKARAKAKFDETDRGLASTSASTRARPTRTCAAR